MSALIANGQLRQTEVDRAVFVDELSLSGQLGPIRGVITTIETAKQVGFQTVYIPNANITQAILIEASTIISVSSLKELFLHLKKEEFISLSETIITQPPTSPPQLIIDDVRGQTQAKRALQIAAAGQHNILLIGLPRAGTTMVARVFVSLLPPVQKPSNLWSQKSIISLVSGKG